KAGWLNIAFNASSPPAFSGAVFNQTPLFFLIIPPSDNDNRIRGGGRETSVVRFSPTIFMIIIIVLFIYKYTT
uniref:hypothetical protein n=1 Tax=uncultured Nostoc sp. TaxID=340711 RepID=UPI0035CA2CD4